MRALTAQRPAPTLVVGGGPATALQFSRHPATTPGSIIVSDCLGGGLAILGDQRLQSYVEELDVGDGTGLRAYAGPWAICPTARQYVRYIRDALAGSGTTIVPGRVADMWIEGALLRVGVLHGDGQERQTLCARRVLLATGLRAKEPAEEWRRVGTLSSDEVYRRLDRRDSAWYQHRGVIIVGSGNSAMQVAALLSPLAKSVTVLARRHVGLYPIETSDRFAWRASSQLTYELIVKGAGYCETGPGPSCIRFLVYDDLTLRDGSIRYRYRAAQNRSPLGVASLPPRHPHLDPRRHASDPGSWTETIPVDEVVVVWAVGYRPVYPGGRLLQLLPRDSVGYLKHTAGTVEGVSGLFVGGACAGYRSVNEMAEVRLDRPA